MTIITTFVSYSYAPEMVTGRYVRCDNEAGRFRWCEVGGSDAMPYDLRQGVCDESDLTPTVIAAARARIGFWPSYVDWPHYD